MNMHTPNVLFYFLSCTLNFWIEGLNATIRIFCCRFPHRIPSGGAAADKKVVAFGMPMGPFRLLDEVGIDVGAHVGPTLNMGLGVSSPAIESIPNGDDPLCPTRISGAVSHCEEDVFFVLSGARFSPFETTTSIVTFREKTSTTINRRIHNVNSPRQK